MTPMQPTCRYHDGAHLERVGTGGKLPNFSILTADLTQLYEIDLYVCKKCGYVEFFSILAQEAKQ